MLNPDKMLNPENQQLNPEIDNKMMNPENAKMLNPENQQLNPEIDNKMLNAENKLLNPENQKLNPENAKLLNPDNQQLNPESDNKMLSPPLKRLAAARHSMTRRGSSCSVLCDDALCRGELCWESPMTFRGSGSSSGASDSEDSDDCQPCDATQVTEMFRDVYLALSSLTQGLYQRQGDSDLDTAAASDEKSDSFPDAGLDKLANKSGSSQDGRLDIQANKFGGSQDEGLETLTNKSGSSEDPLKDEDSANASLSQCDSKTCNPDPSATLVYPLAEERLTYDDTTVVDDDDDHDDDHVDASSKAPEPMVSSSVSSPAHKTRIRSPGFQHPHGWRGCAWETYNHNKLETSTLPTATYTLETSVGHAFPAVPGHTSPTLSYSHTELTRAGSAEEGHTSPTTSPCHLNTQESPARLSALPYPSPLPTLLFSDSNAPLLPPPSPFNSPSPSPSSSVCEASLCRGKTSKSKTGRVPRATFLPRSPSSFRRPVGSAAGTPRCRQHPQACSSPKNSLENVSFLVSPRPTIRSRQHPQACSSPKNSLENVSLVASPLVNIGGVRSQRHPQACSSPKNSLENASFVVSALANMGCVRSQQHPQACSSPKTDEGRLFPFPATSCGPSEDFSCHKRSRGSLEKLDASSVESPVSTISCEGSQWLSGPVLKIPGGSDSPTVSTAAGSSGKANGVEWSGVPCSRKAGSRLVRRLVKRLWPCRGTDSTVNSTTAAYVHELHNSHTYRHLTGARMKCHTKQPRPQPTNRRTVTTTTIPTTLTTIPTPAPTPAPQRRHVDSSTFTDLDWDTTSMTSKGQGQGHSGHVTSVSRRAGGRHGLRSSDLLMSVEQLLAQDRLGRLPMMEVSTARCVTDFLQQRLRTKTYHTTVSQRAKLVTMAHMCSVDTEATVRGVRLTKTRKSRYPVGRDIVRLHLQSTQQ